MSEDKYSTVETKNFRVCPECGGRTRTLGLSLSTREIDVLAILVQCGKNSRHIYAFYYRLEQIKPKWKEFLNYEKRTPSNQRMDSS